MMKSLVEVYYLNPLKMYRGVVPDHMGIVEDKLTLFILHVLWQVGKNISDIEV